MKATRVYWLLFALYFGTANAQQQGYDIILPSSTNPIQNIQNGDYIAQDEIDIVPIGTQEVHLTPQVVGSDQVHLYIDPSVIIPIPYSSNSGNGGSPPNTNITRTLDFSLPVGTTPSQLSVNLVGALNYSVPLLLPPGTKEMQPKISVSYNSMSQNGLVGYGWGIDGIEGISRIGQTVYHNSGSIAPILLTNHDWFTFRGSRLVRTNTSNYGTNGATYRTEVESFNKLTSFGTIGNGPKWFKVETKDGITMEFGNTTDSRLIPDGQNTVLNWMVNKIQDNYGNYISFTYYNSNGEIYIKEINYTGNSAANIQPYNKIAFYYDSRQDQNTTFVAKGTLNSTVILREVEIFSEGVSFKKYNFNYLFNNVFSYLTEIAEHGADGIKYNSLLFSYQDDDNAAAASQQSVSISGQSPHFRAYIPIDTDEDGKEDLISLNYDIANNLNWFDWDILNNLGGSQFNRVNRTTFLTQNFFPLSFYPMNKTQNGNMLFESIDFDGDGKEDIFFISPGGTNQNGQPLLNIDSYLSKNNFALTTSSISAFGIDIKNLIFADINGDKKLDIINPWAPGGYHFSNGVLYNRTRLQVWFDINHTSPDYAQDYYGDVASNALNPNPGAYNFSEIFATDINGDGIAEILNIGGPINSSSPYGKYYLKNGISFEPDLSGLYLGENKYMPAGNSQHSFCPQNTFLNFVGDFNGDLKTDILYCSKPGPQAAAWSLNLGKGDATYEAIGSFSAPFTDPFANCGYIQLARDFNADGKTDVLEYNSAGSTLSFNIYYSQGISFQKESFSANISFLDYALTLGDFNGDGSQDIFIYSQYDLSKDPVIIYLNEGIKSKYLKQAVDGFNVKNEFEFNPLSASGVYTQTVAKTYPEENINGALYVTTKVTRPDGVGGSNSTAYSYQDAILHKTGKGFIGFLKTTEFNSTTNNLTTKEYDYDPTFFNLFPKKVTTLIFSGLNTTLTSRMTYTTNTQSLGGIRYLATFTTTINEDLINGSTIKTDLTFDANGNLHIKEVNVNSGYDVETTTNSYVQSGAWIPSRLSSTSCTIVRGGQPSYTRLINYAYNIQDKGQVSSQTTDLGIQTSFQYDPNVGVIQQKGMIALTDPTVLPRNISYNTFDTYYRFATTTTNEINQISHCVYDGKWGKPKQETGIDGLSTKYAYDGFGRLITSTGPDNLTNSISYAWVPTGSLPNNDPLDVSDIIFSVHTLTPGKPGKTLYYDFFQRERKKTIDGFTEQINWVTTYDSRFNIHKKSGPYQNSVGNSFSPIITTYTYDKENRINKTEVTDGIVSTPLTTQYSYSSSGGNITVSITSPDAKTTTKSTDPLGLVLTASDNGGIITYDYYSNRNIKAITVNGQTMNAFNYDSYGRQNALTDANAGTSTYSYDALSELVYQKDANNKTYNITYDRLGRAVQKLGSEGTYTYQYLQSGPGANRLQQVTSPNNYSNIYSYDVLGRTAQEVETINGQAFTTKYSYDGFNNLQQVTYPSNFSIQYSYTSEGYMKKVFRSDNGNRIWEADEMNPLGQYSKFTLGNNVQTVKEVSNFGLPTSISAGNLLNLQYSFDNTNGNLNQRADIFRNISESFGYDNLNRLANATLGNGLNTQTLAYSNGNISQKSDVGSYAYSNAKPNAVETVSNPGSTISLLEQDITPTAFNKTSSIVEGDYNLNILYGADQQRIETELYYQSALKLSKFFVGNYEKEINHSTNTTREVHYIKAGDGLTAIYVIENGVGTMYYTYSDYLGSILAVSDEVGNKVAEQSFDAWGRNRNPNDWTYASVPGVPEWLYRGFTGHEHLPEFSLVNMNGRMYDPMLGVMLSADNFVQAADKTQNYNRYAYALNNPLKFTDPTGELFGIDDALFIMIAVGVLAGAYQGYEVGEAHGASGAGLFGYVLGGALIGGVSGLIGGEVALSGGAWAATQSILASSLINSMGFNMLGSNSDVSVGFGFGSFDLNNGKFNYLFKGGNTTMQNVGYGLGALGNIDDALAGLHPEDVQLNTEHSDAIGHSSITEVDEADPNASMVSVGPDPGGKWIFNPFKFKKGTNKWTNHLDSPDDEMWTVVVKGVRKNTIKNYGKLLDEGTSYNLYFNSCVNNTARALTMAGAPVIGIHPFILQAEMFLRSEGVRPVLYSYYLTR